MIADGLPYHGSWKCPCHDKLDFQLDRGNKCNILKPIPSVWSLELISIFNQRDSNMYLYHLQPSLFSHYSLHRYMPLHITEWWWLEIWQNKHYIKTFKVILRQWLIFRADTHYTVLVIIRTSFSKLTVTPWNASTHIPLAIICRPSLLSLCCNQTPCNLILLCGMPYPRNVLINILWFESAHDRMLLSPR